MSRPRPSILLIGSSGQIGWELARSLSPLGEVTVPDRELLDLADPRTIAPTVSRVAPDCIVNAAAFTRVDEAEDAPDLAFRVNAEGPGVLAEEAARIGALLVHYSTDYVFDGRSTVPYPEDEPTNPLSVYGESKRAGERAVLASDAAVLILRTSWVFGLRRSNFLKTVLRLARERETLRIVDDQVGAPTWCRSVAEATSQVLAKLQEGSGFSAPPERRQVFHMTASGSTSWHGFATYALERDPARHEHMCREVVPIATEEYPTRAARPRFSVLDNGRLLDTFGMVLADWRTQVDLCLDRSPPARG